MKKEIDEILDELNPDLMLNMTAFRITVQGSQRRD